MKNIPLNYLTLNFDSDSLETLFRKTFSKQSLYIVRVSFMLGVFLYLIFGVLDIWMVPEKLAAVWEIRIVVAALIIIFYFLSFRIFFRNHMQLFLSTITIIIGSGIIGMVMISENEGSYYYYAGLMLVIQFAHGLVRLRFLYASVVTGLIAVIYLLTASLIKNTPTILIINNSFFLFSTIIIGMFISYALEYSARRNFWQAKTLAEQENLLKSEYQRKTTELNNVRELQLSLLPQIIPQHPSIDLAVSLKTALEVGGDYYDYKTDENNILSFAIGDAAGHGAQAGALVTAAKILFSCWQDNDDLLSYINNTSKTIKEMDLPKLFMAMIAGRIDGNRLELAGGGIPPALIYRKNSGTIEEVSLKGLPLGFVSSNNYKKINISLNNGDLILFMTDGFTELFNPKKEMLGIGKIKNALCEAADEKPQYIIDYLNKTAEEWRDGSPLSDDMTLLAFKIKNI